MTLRTDIGPDLAHLSTYLTSKIFGKGIEIITINDPDEYPKYKPYEIIDDEKEFVSRVLEMAT